MVLVATIGIRTSIIEGDIDVDNDRGATMLGLEQVTIRQRHQPRLWFHRHQLADRQWKLLLRILPIFIITNNIKLLLNIKVFEKFNYFLITLKQN